MPLVSIGSFPEVAEGSLNFGYLFSLAVNNFKSLKINNSFDYLDNLVIIVSRDLMSLKVKF